MTIVEISKESLTINQKRSFSYRSLTYFLLIFKLMLVKQYNAIQSFHGISIIAFVFVRYKAYRFLLSTFIGFQDTHYLVFSDILLRQCTLCQTNQTIKVFIVFALLFNLDHRLSNNPLHPPAPPWNSFCRKRTLEIVITYGACIHIPKFEETLKRLC